MINDKKNVTYRGLALILGSLGLVAVACSDDDDATPGGEAGMGGEEAGGTSSTAGTNAAGKTSEGGKSGGGSGGSAGSGGSTAGTNVGGQAPVAGMGAGGELGMAGMDMGGAPGVAGSGDGGAGGAPVVVVPADTLDWGNFGGEGDWNAVVAAWPMSGDTDAASVQKWVWDSQPGVGFWRATAYKITMSQLVSPLPAGTYSFSLEVDRGTNLNEQYLFAKGCKAGEPDAQVTKITESGRAVYTLADIEVTSGSCTVGIYTDAPADGWANVDNAAFALQ